MREYQVFYKDGRHEIVNCESKNMLIRDHFEGNENSFNMLVTRIICTSQTSYYVEDISSSSKNVMINCADINPYGWRD